MTTICRPALAIMTAGVLSICASAQDSAVGTMTLQQCRDLALTHNKQLMMSRERVRKAEAQKGEAFAAYLPALDFNGGYVYNQRELSLLAEDQMLPTKSFDPRTQSYQYNLVTNPMTGEPIKGPNGQYIPSTVAIIPKEAMTFDIHNVFFGAVTLTQPIFMGGKIIAMNKITRAAERAARELGISEAENVIYAVDAAYWMVISLEAKQKLAKSYVDLLEDLNHNVDLMVKQGVATRADALSVEVKLNSAKVDLTKVDNGLVLSRMALAQVCGLPVDTQMKLADSGIDAPTIVAGAETAETYDMQQVFANRPDLRALEQAVEVAHQQKNVALSEMLPNLAVVGSYEVSNPNVYNGFEKKFKGAFSVGAMLKIPIWHWGGHTNKIKAAAADENIRKFQLEEARELITLQVNQASFKTQEAFKTYHATTTNLAKADENLRSANLAFREGMGTTELVLAAQTAWLQAHSGQIDAMIDVQLCQTYLSKVLGTLYR